MSLQSFLNALYETGRVPVDDPGAPRDAGAADIDAILGAFDARAREQLAFTAPRFTREAAHWSAALMYRGCQSLVYRRLDEPAVKGVLGVESPTRLSPDTIYSADLVLYVLPELDRMARAVAEKDVLVGELRRIGGAWPLSSVGMPQMTANEIEPSALELIMHDRSLRQLYIDRVIARRDRSRLEHSDVRDGVLQAIGMYDELWPEAGLLH